MIWSARTTILRVCCCCWRLRCHGWASTWQSMPRRRLPTATRCARRRAIRMRGGALVPNGGAGTRPAVASRSTGTIDLAIRCIWSWTAPTADRAWPSRSRPLQSCCGTPSPVSDRSGRPPVARGCTAARSQHACRNRLTAQPGFVLPFTRLRGKLFASDSFAARQSPPFRTHRHTRGQLPTGTSGQSPEVVRVREGRLPDEPICQCACCLRATHRGGSIWPS